MIHIHTEFCDFLKFDINAHKCGAKIPSKEKVQTDRDTNTTTEYKTPQSWEELKNICENTHASPLMATL